VLDFKIWEGGEEGKGRVKRGWAVAGSVVGRRRISAMYTRRLCVHRVSLRCLSMSGASSVRIGNGYRIAVTNGHRRA